MREYRCYELQGVGNIKEIVRRIARGVEKFCTVSWSYGFVWDTGANDLFEPVARRSYFLQIFNEEVFTEETNSTLPVSKLPSIS
jgi:hypothetical protein